MEVSAIFFSSLRLGEGRHYLVYMWPVSISKMKVIGLAVGLTLLLGVYVLTASAKKGPLVTDKVSLVGFI